MSDFGTPIHCALLGVYRVSRILDEDVWFAAADHYMIHGREAVLNLLLQHGGDLTLPFKLLDTEYSCAQLALHAWVGQGDRHPLMILIKAGVPIDDHLMEDIENLFSKGDHGKKFWEAFFTSLETTRFVGDAKSKLLRAALQFKSSSVIELAKIEFSFCQLDIENLSELFYRAT